MEVFMTQVKKPCYSLCTTVVLFVLMIIFNMVSFGFAGIEDIAGSSARTPEYDGRVLKVATDGNGEFRSVQAAIDAISPGNDSPVTIAIEPGEYRERIVVPANKRHICFVGQDATNTILVNGLYATMLDEKGVELGTGRTPSVTIEADDFTARKITFANDAGSVSQAIALAVFGDRCIFDQCRVTGNQDTLLADRGRQYYWQCYISGTTDFIFGGATAYFDNCQIHCLKSSYITAASTPQDKNYGYVFNQCRLTGENDKIVMYFGRPWNDYAKVIFMNSELDVKIHKEGWHNWGKPNREKTTCYAEYNSFGLNHNSDLRANWSQTLSRKQAEEITIKTVLGGTDHWEP